MALVKALNENNNTLTTLDLRNNYLDLEIRNEMLKVLGKKIILFNGWDKTSEKLIQAREQFYNVALKSLDE
ncbi:18310_t:CDS:2, partial [Racocetra fulgida]